MHSWIFNEFLVVGRQQAKPAPVHVRRVLEAVQVQQQHVRQRRQPRALLGLLVRPARVAEELLVPLERVHRAAGPAMDLVSPGLASPVCDACSWCVLHTQQRADCCSLLRQLHPALRAQQSSPRQAAARLRVFSLRLMCCTGFLNRCSTSAPIPCNANSNFRTQGLRHAMVAQTGAGSASGSSAALSRG